MFFLYFRHFTRALHFKIENFHNLLILLLCVMAYCSCIFGLIVKLFYETLLYIHQTNGILFLGRHFKLMKNVFNSLHFGRIFEVNRLGLVINKKHAKYNFRFQKLIFFFG